MFSWYWCPDFWWHESISARKCVLCHDWPEFRNRIDSGSDVPCVSQLFWTIYRRKAFSMIPVIIDTGSAALGGLFNTLGAALNGLVDTLWTGSFGG